MYSFILPFWIELKPCRYIALTAYCQARPWSCARWGGGPLESKRGASQIAQWVQCRAPRTRQRHSRPRAPAELGLSGFGGIRELWSRSVAIETMAWRSLGPD